MVPILKFVLSEPAGHVEVVRLLLEAGADKKSASSNGTTASVAAVEHHFCVFCRGPNVLGSDTPSKAMGYSIMYF